MGSLARAVVFGTLEKLPLVEQADVNGDGTPQLVVGPQPRDSVTKKLGAELPDRRVSVGPVVVVLGVV